MTETNEYRGSVTIGQDQSAAFARLSGDQNPLHVDPVAARRLQFGCTVLHGVHHLLQTLDTALSEISMPPDRWLGGLRASFHHPVRADDRIDWTLSLRADGSGGRLESAVSGKRVLALSFDLLTRHGDSPVVEILDAEPSPEEPLDQAFPPAHQRGRCALYFDHGLGSALLPHLSNNVPASLLSQILACTKVVGMRCPGLHSVFSRLQLEVRDRDARDGNALHYRVEASDARFQLVKIAVEGPHIIGVLDAFFRPAAVDQASYETVRALVASDRFAGRRALVIGGSRGLGETTAKILAAGGAVVTITYNFGEADAHRVVAEIADGGGDCRARHCDIVATATDRLQLILDECDPNIIYYFASPKISSNANNEWNVSLFKKYCEIYLTAFSRLVSVIGRSASAAAGKISIYYPSSIYVECPEKGFSEYAVAKAAGEALCRQLSHRFSQIDFTMPRLPRMSTDQTASIVPIQAEPALTVMMDSLEVGHTGS
jgi:acyl dehydratase